MTNENHLPPVSFDFHRVNIFFWYHLRMKSIYYISLLPMFFLVVACSGPEQSATESSMVFDALENLANDPETDISHEDGWAIVSKMENGDQVYWFLAPNENNVSPAQYKKTIHVSGNDEKETQTVSQCVAPRQVCDDLMERFKIISKKYK